MPKSRNGQLLLPGTLQLSLRQAWEQFHRQPDHSPGYVSECRTALNHWARCSPGNPPIGLIDNAVMQAFRARCLDEPLPSTGKPPSAGRFNAILRIIEAILSTLGPRTSGNPFALGILPEVPRCRPAEESEAEVVIASLPEIEAIYEACREATWPRLEATGLPPDLLWQALIVFIHNVALRKGDFLKLRKSHVRLREGLLLVEQGKTGKFRPLPLNQTVIRHLHAIWHSRGDLLFPFPRSKRDLYAQWEKIQVAAEISVPRESDSRRRPVYGFHELRKTSLTEFYCLDQRAAQAMGGHASLMTTIQHYVNAARREGLTRRAAEELPQPAAFLREEGPAPTPPDHPTLRLFVG